MGSRGSTSGRKSGGKLKAYDDYDKTVHDTVIVEHNGTYRIEFVGDRNLDEDFGQVREMNHDKLMDNLYYSTSKNANKWEKEIYKDISIKDVFDYLKKQFNWKPRY